MPFSKLLQRISLGLIILWGVLVLVLAARWLHYWMYGWLNPNEIDLDDWLFSLSMITWLLQAAASMEALFIGAGTRFRWISYQRGQVFVGLFSLIPIAYMLHGFWWAISNPYVSFGYHWLT
ncbi:hypothetical protein IQ260_20880 [Leptolyngbya cf. ectocarpi LEGE 11479]|uniref:Uncharacterized protein n=1 Tax=Leptolyngbya cf. ectocarpi LEGE 11479 TaxID=1828722 RepID=A0A928ZXB1_LEPEC|nr:hypothetical protein [Leptolyngbya ectocarpi]MBE9069105.1 hypothetical protein [Leptolyngbya cf. ectocarpi LEGE 11479]